MDLSAVECVTPALWGAGFKILQTYRFADGEFNHVDRLLGWLDPVPGARIIDLGCGVGEVARLIRLIRPDVGFTLVNISPVQMDYCPQDVDLCCADMLDVPRESGAYDCATFMFSIGHVDAPAALVEARRLLKPGGVLFIVDMHRVFGDNAHMSRTVAYAVLMENEFRAAAQDAGFVEDFCLKPRPVGNVGPAVCGSQDAYDAIFSGVEPIVWRFIKP